MKYFIRSGSDELDRIKWKSFVDEHPHGTVFQSPDMFDLYRKVENYKPVILAVEDESGKIKILVLAVIIKDYKGLMGYFSSRTLIYGGPLIDPKELHPEKMTELLLDALIMTVQQASIYVQIRNLYDLSLFEPIFRKKGFYIQDHLNLIVSTVDQVQAFSSISKSKIRQAKQSLRNGSEICLAENEEEVKELYALLKRIYKQKIKKPLPPETMFLDFFRASQQGKLGLILLAKYQSKVIGGMVCPVTPGKSLNEWYICGLDRIYPKIHPSVLLTYGAIEYALNNQIPSFDFMGIGSPDIPYGVRDFKTRFGGRTINYGRFIRINKKIAFRFAKMGFTMLSSLKVFRKSKV